MHGLQGIRNINAAHRERVAQQPAAFAAPYGRDQSEDRKPPRFQRQSRSVDGTTYWSVYDTRNGGWGFKSLDVVEVDREVDQLNAANDLLGKREQQDGVNAALAAKAVS